MEDINFKGKIFMIIYKSTKSAKVFTLKIISLYNNSVIHFNFYVEELYNKLKEFYTATAAKDSYTLYFSKYVYSSCLQQADTYSRIGAEVKKFYSAAGEI